jgi:hypothetical protein
MQVTADVTECAEVCYADANCVFFTFETSTGECYRFDGTPTLVQDAAFDAYGRLIDCTSITTEAATNPTEDPGVTEDPNVTTDDPCLGLGGYTVTPGFKHANNNLIIDTLVIGDVAACAESCSALSNCAFFTFRASNMQCRRFTGVPPLETNSDFDAYERNVDCFSTNPTEDPVTTEDPNVTEDPCTDGLNGYLATRNAKHTNEAFLILIDMQITAGAVECAEFCYADDNCAFFTFGMSTGECFRFNGTPTLVQDAAFDAYGKLVDCIRSTTTTVTEDPPTTPTTVTATTTTSPCTGNVLFGAPGVDYSSCTSSSATICYPVCLPGYATTGASTGFLVNCELYNGDLWNVDTGNLECTATTTSVTDTTTTTAPNPCTGTVLFGTPGVDYSSCTSSASGVCYPVCLPGYTTTGASVGFLTNCLLYNGDLWNLDTGNLVCTIDVQSCTDYQEKTECKANDCKWKSGSGTCEDKPLCSDVISKKPCRRLSYCHWWRSDKTCKTEEPPPMLHACDLDGKFSCKSKASCKWHNPTQTCSVDCDVLTAWSCKNENIGEKFCDWKNKVCSYKEAGLLPGN